MKWKLNQESENSQVFFNFIATVIRSGIAFLTMPLFTRLLGTEQYGLYSVYHSWQAIGSCIVGLGVGSALGTGYYKFGKDYYKFKSSTLLEGIMISIAIIFILLLCYPILHTIVLYPFSIFLILLMEAFAQFVMSFATMAWIYEKNALSNMLFAIISLLLTTSISIALLWNWKSNLPLYYGRVFGTALPTILIAIGVVVGIFIKQLPHYNKTYWIYSLGFGLPLVFHQLSQQILGQSDRVMMQMFGILADEIGIYSFFYSFCNIVMIILTALNNAWCPFLYDNLQKKDYDELNRKIKNYVQVFTVLSVGFLMLSHEVAKIFADNTYWSGISLIPILVLSTYFVFIYQFAVNYEFYMAKTKVVATGTIVAGILNMIANTVLIPRWGMYGAAVATMLSYVILSCIHFFVVRYWKLERYPLRTAPVIAGVVIVLFASVIYYVIADLWFLRWGIGAALGIYLVLSIHKRRSIF